MTARKRAGPTRRPKTAKRDAWVIFSRAEDVPGEWLAHCLDLDVMSQGRSLSHALEMVAEAVKLVVDEDRAAGLDPFDRKAPQAKWRAELYEHMPNAKPAPLAELVRLADEGKLSWMATTLSIPFAGASSRAVRKPAEAGLGQHASAAA